MHGIREMKMLKTFKVVLMLFHATDVFRCWEAHLFLDCLTSCFYACPDRAGWQGSEGIFIAPSHAEATRYNYNPQFSWEHRSLPCRACVQAAENKSTKSPVLLLLDTRIARSQIPLLSWHTQLQVGVPRFSCDPRASWLVRRLSEFSEAVLEKDMYAYFNEGFIGFIVENIQLGGQHSFPKE